MLGACTESRSPIEVVQSFMGAVEALDLAAAEGFVCEAQRAQIQDSLLPFDSVAGLGEAFDIRFENLSFQERSNDGQVSVVRVNGTLTISFLGQHDVQEVDEEHTVVRENGRWVICDP
jgi:hypothetical protein